MIKDIIIAKTTTSIYYAMEKPSIGFIIATHCHLGEVLVETAEIILQKKTSFKAFSFREGEKPQNSSKRLKALIKKLENGRGVIIMVDLFGGTPGTLALSMLDEKMVEVITGVNLPMLMTASMIENDLELSEASRKIVSASRDAIKEAGLILKQ